MKRLLTLFTIGLMVTAGCAATDDASGGSGWSTNEDGESQQTNDDGTDDACAHGGSAVGSSTTVGGSSGGTGSTDGVGTDGSGGTDGIGTDGGGGSDGAGTDGSDDDSVGDTDCYSGGGGSTLDPDAEQVGESSRASTCEQEATEDYCSGNCEGTYAEGYCKAERLVWSYDRSANTASFDHVRVLMNCCASQRRTEAYLRSDGTYEIREIFQLPPTDSGGQCTCQCPRDFGVDIPEVSGEIDVRIVHAQEAQYSEETQWAHTEQVWRGTIDLSESSGAVIVSREEPRDADESLLTDEYTPSCK